MKLFSSTGLLTVMFGAAGTLVNISTRAQNLGKVPYISETHTVYYIQLACSILGR